MLFFNFIILLLDPDPKKFGSGSGRIRKSWIRYIPNYLIFYLAFGYSILRYLFRLVILDLPSYVDSACLINN